MGMKDLEKNGNSNSNSSSDCTSLMTWWDYKSRVRSIYNVKSWKLTAGLTFLQFVFAMYATFLLYFMSPTLDVISGPEIAWASHIAQQWREFVVWTPPNNSNITTTLLNNERRMLLGKESVCEFEEITFEQKKSSDAKMISLKTELFNEIMNFQHQEHQRETLEELMAMPSSSSEEQVKVTVILNHFKRKTLCAQLDALLQQTHPVYAIWVLAFGSPNADSLKRIVHSYNDTRIQFIGSTYDFKYYGRFQIALQVDSSNYVYMIDDDMIPGKKMVQILTHVAGTLKYSNSVLGSIGRILPFRQKDYTFPSYRKFGSREAGIYIPDPAYGIVVDRIVQVDFLSSSWFLAAQSVKALFIETPFTFSTGEDLHLSYQMQKYRDAGSYALPIDPSDKDTWGDSEHRLAYVSETTVIHKNIVQVRDEQWWRALSRGYVTQWAAMHPQRIDAFFYAHSLDQVSDMAPLIQKFRIAQGKKAYVIVSGGIHCPCDEASGLLGWPATVCKERRFKIFDLELGSVSTTGIGITQEIYASLKGLLRIHSPALLITVADQVKEVMEAIELAVAAAPHTPGRNSTAIVRLPRPGIPHALWIPDVKSTALQQWNRMTISISIITQNRPTSLLRLLNSLSTAHYLGDDIHISFNMDAAVDSKTLQVVHDFQWPHGHKTQRRRIIPGGLIRAVSESWYPANDHDYGLLLEDDIEVSPFYYIWLKYSLLSYVYADSASADSSPPLVPELGSIALYTPRLVEVVKERPKWNATDFFKALHPNTPYLHQLPCSWGALFFPKFWREFYKYMGTRYTEDAKANPVQIPRSRTNGWQASWKKFLIDLMYLRGYVSLYPNFPNQTSFSTNHMEPGAHIAASDNALRHKAEDFTVPLLMEDFWKMLPLQKMPPASRLPVINLFNQATSIRGLKSSGAKLAQDVINCTGTGVVAADRITGDPLHCTSF